MKMFDIHPSCVLSDPDLQWLIQSQCGFGTIVSMKLQSQSPQFLLGGHPSPWDLASENDSGKSKNEIWELLQHPKKNEFMTEANCKALSILKTEVHTNVVGFFFKAAYICISEMGLPS